MHGAAGDVDAAKAAWLRAGGEAAAVAAAQAAAQQQAGGGGTATEQGDGVAAASAAGAAAGEHPNAEQACLHAAWVAALAQAGRLQDAAAALASMLDRFAAVLPVEVSLPGSGGDSGGSGDSGGQPRPQLPGSVPTAGSGGSSGDGISGGEGRQPPAARTVLYLQDARNAVLAAARARGDHSVAQRVASLATLRGLPPDVGTYNGLLLGALGHGDGLQAVLVSAADGGEPTSRRCSLRAARAVGAEPFALLLALLACLPCAWGLWNCGPGQGCMPMLPARLSTRPRRAPARCRTGCRRCARWACAQTGRRTRSCCAPQRVGGLRGKPARRGAGLYRAATASNNGQGGLRMSCLATAWLRVDPCPGPLPQPPSRSPVGMQPSGTPRQPSGRLTACRQTAWCPAGCTTTCCCRPTPQPGTCRQGALLVGCWRCCRASNGLARHSHARQ